MRVESRPDQLLNGREKIDRRRSQILGLGILVMLVLLIACIRYYFSLG